MTRLDEILSRKREEVRAAKARVPEEALAAQARAAPPPRPFREALTPGGGAPSFIAEVKRASPSAGAIAPGADAAAQASRYARGGAAAAAISVLTDGPGFGGSLDDLRAVRAAVGVPVLRKDFVVDAYQLLEARAAGADAVLLIAAALDDLELGRLLARSGELGLTALVEVHGAEELDRALAAGATLIGVNNRNLKTFEVDLATSERLLPRIPDRCVGVVESGVRSPDDARRLGRAGAVSFLVGEALMRADDPAALLRRLRGAAATSFRVKICGVRRAEDATEAARAGADAVGFNFWEGSKRYCAPAAAAEAVRALPPRVRAVGLLVDPDPAAAAEILRQVPLAAVQVYGRAELELEAPRIGTLAVRSAESIAAAAAAGLQGDAVLLDTPTDGHGGSGRAFDWGLAAGAGARLGRPVILAGGLTAGNVAGAIRAARPDAVDVASGVESAPGVKDPQQLQRFVAAAREAFAS